MELIVGLFWSNVACHLLLLAGAVWCVVCPDRRIYPMTTKNGYYYAMWLMFWFVFGSTAALGLLDWNTGVWDSPLRFLLGVPVALLGAGLVSWGIATLGIRNTSGLPDGLITSGPYAFTRNPQYVGDILLFIGLAIIANSEMVLVTNLLTTLVFVVAPLTEEPWVEAQYGEPYCAYRARVSRFL